MPDETKNSNDLYKYLAKQGGQVTLEVKVSPSDCRLMVTLQPEDGDPVQFDTVSSASHDITAWAQAGVVVLGYRAVQASGNATVKLRLLQNAKPLGGTIYDNDGNAKSSIPGDTDGAVAFGPYAFGDSDTVDIAVKWGH